VTPQITPSHHQDQSDYSSDTDHHGSRLTQRDPNTVPRSRYNRPDPQHRSDIQHRVNSHHRDPQVDSHQLDPRANFHQLDPRVGAHQLDPHVGVHHLEPHTGARRLEPHAEFFRPEPAVGPSRIGPLVVTRCFHDTRCDTGRGSQSYHSSPPSPTPLPRTISPQLLTPHVHQHTNPPTVTQSCSLPQPETREPVIAASDHSELGDVYDLDHSYVQLCDIDCVRAIHTPPRGQCGPKGRWYFVCVGREVGIFNNW